MGFVKRVVLDVLKPHSPNTLEFANTIADNNRQCRVNVRVVEVDEKTETTVVTIEGQNIPYDKIVETITNLGGSVHSIDEVEVINSSGDE